MNSDDRVPALLEWIQSEVEKTQPQQKSEPEGGWVDGVVVALLVGAPGILVGLWMAVALPDQLEKFHIFGTPVLVGLAAGFLGMILGFALSAPHPSANYNDPGVVRQADQAERSKWIGAAYGLLGGFFTGLLFVPCKLLLQGFSDTVLAGAGALAGFLGFAAGGCLLGVLGRKLGRRP